jgi:hypothetical protein
VVAQRAMLQLIALKVVARPDLTISYGKFEMQISLKKIEPASNDNHVINIIIINKNTNYRLFSLLLLLLFLHIIHVMYY